MSRSRAPTTELAYIGLGSNLAGPAAQLTWAVHAVRRLGVEGTLRCSPLYRTAPVGPPDQPDFFNAVVTFQTALEPEALLVALLALERQRGRQRGCRWGPRVLDLDLLLYGRRILSSPQLCVPHARIAERAFVLRPLRDLDCDLEIPGVGCVAALLERCSDQRIERVDWPA